MLVIERLVTVVNVSVAEQTGQRSRKQACSQITGKAKLCRFTDTILNTGTWTY